MHKKIAIIMMVLVMVLSLAACKSSDEPASDGLLNEDLVKLLPNEGFSWAYIGGAEYYHEMTLDSITKDEHQAIYKITGEVDDVSGNGSESDYKLEIFYEINSDSIVQRKTEQMMLDSEYDEITLIKAPLQEGTTWSEEIIDRDGKKQTINAEIYEVTQEEKGTMYKVLYQNPKTGYLESRKIMEGYGVVAFSQSVEIDGQKFQYGYGLYGKKSGYLEVTNEDVVEDTTDQSDDGDQADQSSDGDATDSNEGTDEPADTDTEETTGSEDQGEDAVETVDESEAVRAAIQSFNDAWIDYVNNNNRAFFNYVVENSTAYNNAVKFDRTGLTEKFLKMDIGRPTVNGKVATVKVYEEIQKTKDGDVSVAKYNWLYELVKVDGKWLVKSYSKQ